MRTYLVSLAVGACCAAAIGCGSSNNGGNNTDAGPVDSAPPSDAGPPVAVIGHIYANGQGDGGGSGAPPLEGATVSIAGASPAITTTSAADGSYTLMVPSGQTVFVRAAMTSYLSEQIGAVLGGSGATVDLSPIPTDQVTMAGSAVGITFDMSKGEVEVDFSNQGSAVDGFGATVSSAHDPSFTCGNGNSCAAATTTTDDNNLVFPNVAPGGTTVTVSAPAGHSCTLRVPGITSFRVDAFVLTKIAFDCN